MTVETQTFQMAEQAEVDQQMLVQMVFHLTQLVVEEMVQQIILQDHQKLMLVVVAEEFIKTQETQVQLDQADLAEEETVELHFH